MVLRPLEYSECLLDTPYLRENIAEHERELDKTNESIKGLLKESRSVVLAMNGLSKAMKSFGSFLRSFQMNCLEEADVDDDVDMRDAFTAFSEMISLVEDYRSGLLKSAESQLIRGLERFRDEHLLQTKETKKQYQRDSEKFYGMLERHLALSPKKKESGGETDINMEHSRLMFQRCVLSYASKLQEISLRKKFELTEIMLVFMYALSNFYHSGHEACQDHKPYYKMLQMKIQSMQERFSATKIESDNLMNKTLTIAEGRLNGVQRDSQVMQGYLYIQDKRKGMMGAGWTLHYCCYTKKSRVFSMIPYIPGVSKPVSLTDTFIVSSCSKMSPESIDRYFCLEITGEGRPAPVHVQALGENDLNHWVRIMEAKTNLHVELNRRDSASSDVLNDFWIKFIQVTTERVENTCIKEQGIYRLSGVVSKSQRLLQLVRERVHDQDFNLSELIAEQDSRTVTSALKVFLRDLQEPVLTSHLYDRFISAARSENKNTRIASLMELVMELPPVHRTAAKIIVKHLSRVAEHSEQNLMQAGNLGVVFGPTLLKTKEESMAAVLNLRYQSVTVEVMIKDYSKIFDDPGPVLETTTDAPESLLQHDPLSDPTGSALSRHQTHNTRAQAQTPLDDDLEKKKNVTNLKYSHAFVKKPLLPEIKPTRTGSTELTSSRGKSEEESKPMSPNNSSGDLTSMTSMESFDDSFLPDTTYLQRSHLRALPRRLRPPKQHDKEKNNAGLSTPETATTMQDKHSSGAETVLALSVKRTARALYNCNGENVQELSFEVDDILTDVVPSSEPGWLIGSIGGRRGLVPENYVDFV